MRPFLCTMLKCKKCNSVQIPSLIVEEMKRIETPENIPALKLEDENIKSMISTLMDHRPSFFTTEEEEQILLDLESPDCSNSQIIPQILFGCDIVSGCLICANCSDESKIKNSILELV